MSGLEFIRFIFHAAALVIFAIIGLTAFITDGANG